MGLKHTGYTGGVENKINFLNSLQFQNKSNTKFLLLSVKMKNEEYVLK